MGSEYESGLPNSARKKVTIVASLASKFGIRITATKNIDEQKWTKKVNKDGASRVSGNSFRLFLPKNP